MKVIAVTGPWPDAMFKPDGTLQPDFDTSKLFEHGAVFDGEGFVSYAETNYAQVQALFDAQFADVRIIGDFPSKLRGREPTERSRS